MTKLTVIVLIFLILGYDVFVVSYAHPVGTEDEEEGSAAQRLMKSLNPLDLGNFVTYHLALEAERQGRNDVEIVQGFERITKIKYNDYSTISVPQNFGRNLLNWSESAMVLMRKEISRKDYMSGVKVCFPSGCVDPNDVGSNCCPF